MSERSSASESTMQADAPRPSPATRRPGRTARVLLWTGGVLFFVLAVLAATLAILFHRAAPMLRASLIDTLQKRFHSRVELDSLNISIVDGFWVEGRGLRIWLPEDLSINLQSSAPWRAQPWLSVNTLRFHASWWILPGKPVNISVIHVDGARVLLPPKQDRPKFSSQSGSGAPASSSSLLRLPPILVHRIECEQAQLIIEHSLESGKPAKAPLDFELKKIVLTPDGHNGPIGFSVEMVNAKPVGDIHSTGHFGPLASDMLADPGTIPVNGDYSFDHADLSTIKGIAGILSSTGHYTGRLGQIEVEGQTQTPDFRLERVHKGAGIPLNTRFHAIVDGTNGDTQLQPVDATLGHTHFIARGEVVRAQDAPDGKPGDHGHDIRLDVLLDRGRIDDILAISADTEKPFMTGNLTLHTAFHLPPNAPDKQLSVVDRLQLDGQFHLSHARFNNATMQGKIEDLSVRGQGKPDEVKTTDPDSIFSEVEGHFKLADGSLQLPDLVYQVPGAKILAHGAYGLQGGTLSFEGNARLDAELSNVVGGWKGLLLKPMDRYLKKNGAGTDVPIHIQGTRKDPKFGVDFDRLGKTDKSANPGSR